MRSAEAIHHLQVIDASACGVLPGRAVVACPLHQVLELPPAAKQAEVQDLVHIVLLAVNLNQGRRELVLARERVVSCVLQQGDAVDGVDANGSREA